MANNKRKKGFRNNKNLTSLNPKEELKKKPILIETVEIKEFGFVPNTIQVQRGTIVRWFNQEDSSSHSISSSLGLFKSPIIHEGGQFETKFDSVGVFEYYCNMYPFMGGKIEVLESHHEENPIEENPENFELVSSNVENEGNTNNCTRSQNNSSKNVPVMQSRSFQCKSHPTMKDNMTTRLQNQLSMWNHSKGDNQVEELISDENRHFCNYREKMKDKLSKKYIESPVLEEVVSPSSLSSGGNQENHERVIDSIFAPISVPGPYDSQKKDIVYIDIDDYEIKPSQLTIAVGTTVVYRFIERKLCHVENHDIRIRRIVTPHGGVVKNSSTTLCSLSCRESRGWKFEQCCTFEYDCSVNSFMKGSITVVEKLDIERQPEETMKKKKNKKKKVKKSKVFQQVKGSGGVEVIDEYPQPKQHIFTGRNQNLRNKKPNLKWIRRKSNPDEHNNDTIDISENAKHEEPEHETIIDKNAIQNWIQFGDIVCPLNSTLDSKNIIYDVVDSTKDMAHVQDKVVLESSQNNHGILEAGPSKKQDSFKSPPLSPNVFDCSAAEEMLDKRWKSLDCSQIFKVRNLHAVPKSRFRLERIYHLVQEFRSRGSQEV